MKALLLPIFVSVLTFFIAYSLLGNLFDSQIDSFIEMDAIVISDDDFQLFYLQEGMHNYVQSKSVRVEVEGSPVSQLIVFPLDNIGLLKQLRIDLGSNVHQQDIDIKSVRIISRSFDATFDNAAFLLSDCVSLVKEKYQMYVENSTYDPYVILDEQTLDSFQLELHNSILLRRIGLILLSLMFSFTTFFVVFYQNLGLNVFFLNSYILFFCIVLIIPSSANILGLKFDSGVDEKRVLIARPKIAFSSDLPQLIEAYYNDHFGLRSLLISINSRLKLNIFASSPKPTFVQFGKDGYAFLVDSYDAYDSYSNNNLLTDSVLELAYQSQLAITNKLKSRGIDYIIGVWPNKHTVYSNKLPLSLKFQKYNPISLTDQILDFFPVNHLPVVDVRADLIEARSDDQLYLKLDSHWSDHGAFIAYQSFCVQTSSLLNLQPLDKSDFEISFRTLHKGDLTNLMGVSEVPFITDYRPHYALKDKSIDFTYLEASGLPSKSVVTTNENCNNGQTVLIFRDSYSSALIKFLSLHFPKVVYIWCPNPTFFDMSLVDDIQPDVVMSLSVERYLPNLLNSSVVSKKQY